MHSKSDSSRVVTGIGKDEISQKLDTLLHNYQICLKHPKRDTNFIFDYVSGMYYVCHKTTMNAGGSCENSKWIKNKKATKNPKNDDDNCF